MAAYTCVIQTHMMATAARGMDDGGQRFWSMVK
jgi:hypothetical protein